MFGNHVLNFVQYHHFMRLNLWTKLNVNPLSRIFEGLRLCHIIIYLTVFITACYYQFEIFPQSSVIFDIGLCLRSSSSSSLTVVAFQNFSLSHLRHRTLSGVVGVFIAGVVIFNFSLNNHYRHHRRRTLPDVVNVFMNGNIILKFLSM